MAQRKNKKTKTKKGKTPGQPRSSAASAKSGLRGYALLLFAFSLLLYANSFKNDFALDDAIVITQNEFTTQGIAGIPGLLKYDTFRGFFKEAGKDKLVSGGRYRPASPVFFAFMVQLFGLNPLPFHIANALFYALSVVLLFYLFFMWLSPNDTSDQKRRSLALSFGTALLFAAHPVHTEVVANIKGLDEIFALLGSLATAWFITRAGDQKRMAPALLAALIFFVALLSKENSITFLGIIPLALYFFRPGLRPAQMLKYLAPVGAATFAFLLLRGSILGWSLGEPVRELLNNPFLKWSGQGYIPYTGAEKMATIAHSLLEYLRLLVFPHPLTHDYYPKHISLHTFGSPTALLGLLFYLGLAAYAVWGSLRRQLPAFGVAWYLLSLSIVSNIVFPVGVFMSERFLYMPSVGFALVLAWGLYRLFGKSEPLFRLPKTYLLALTLIALLFGLKTISRNPAWKDDYTLFTTDIRVSQNSAKLQNSTGGKMVERAQTLEDDRQRLALIRKAIPHFQKAIELHPLFKNAYLQLGNAHVYLGEYEKALPYYDQALRIDPNYVEAVTNKGVALAGLHRYEEALAQYQQALQLKPSYSDARQRKITTLREAGRFFGQQNQLDKALHYLHLAEKEAPTDFATLHLLGVAYGFANQNDKAIQYFQKALQYAQGKDAAIIYFDLGSAYYNANQPDKGAEYHQKAIQIDPELKKRMGG